MKRRLIWEINPREVDGMYGVGESTRDWLLWSDVDPVDLAPMQDLNVVEYNQYSQLGWKLRSACTIMWPLTALSTMYNIEFNDQELEDYFDNSHLEEGKGWYTQAGVDYAVKHRNKKFPNQKVVYVRTAVFSDEFWEAYNKNYAIVVSFRGNRAYNEDYKTDSILHGSEYWKPIYWHVTCRYKGWKDGIYVLDTAEGRTYNRYQIMKAQELMNKYYYPACYVIVPDPSFTPKPNPMDDKQLQASIMMQYINNKILYMTGEDEEKKLAASLNRTLRDMYDIDDEKVEEAIATVSL